MLIQAGGTRVLLDAGMTVLQLQKRLSKYGVALRDLDAVFLTHEHGDHSRSAYLLSRHFGVPVIANPATLTVLARENAPPNWLILDTGESMTLRDILIESFPISHDAADPVGYSIHCRESKVSFVTDTGVAGDDVRRRIEAADLAVIEANHDVERLIAGPYPEFLKARVLSDVGHLSNEAAADLILAHADEARRPTCVWLAHLSRINNSPRLARRYVQRRLSEAACGNVVLGVVPRDNAGLTWRPDARAVQMELFQEAVS